MLKKGHGEPPNGKGNTLAEKLVAFREKRDLSQADLARLARTNQATISRAEAGKPLRAVIVLRLRRLIGEVNDAVTSGAQSYRS